VSHRPRRRLRLAVALAAVGLAGATTASVALGHTTIESSEPRNNAVLGASPAQIRIRFEHPAMLTSVAVEAAGQKARRLEFEPMTSALDFTLLDPQLVPGRNEIRWKGLSDDGHVIGGTLVFVVDPHMSAF
jgi:copper resistance protein C